MGLRSDGTVVQEGGCNEWARGTEDWEDVVAISASDSQTLGLTRDGRVLGCANNSVTTNGYQADVYSWTNVIQISAGMHHCVGIDKNGRILICGSNGQNQYDILNYSP